MRVFSLFLCVLIVPIVGMGQSRFTKVLDQPVFTVSPMGNWDSRSVGHPSIIREQNEYNMHLVVTREPTVLDFPMDLDGFLFFVDRADLSDNKGKATVTFRRAESTEPYLHRVAKSPLREGWYCWSPDSRYIAYIEEGAPPERYDNRKNKLHVVSADGLEDRVIYEGVAIGYGYAVDWVGDRIAFIKAHEYKDNPNYYEPGDGDAYWIHPDGTGLERITNTIYGSPGGVHTFRWGNIGDMLGTLSDVVRLFPDLSRVAFIAHNGNGWYHPYVASTSDLSQVIHINDHGHLNGLYLSEDGSFLLYEQAGNWNLPHDIRRVNSDGTNDVLLVPGIDVSEGLEFAISPNMQQFVFTVGQREDQRDIAVADINGTNQRLIVGTSADEFFSHFSDRSYQRRNPKGIWSPDGTRIVFTRVAENGKTDVYLFDLSTSTEVRLTKNRANDYDASFSPDGSKIAFISDRSGNPDIWVLDLTLASVTQYTKMSDRLPKTHVLVQNYPNPFNSSTTISYNLSHPDVVDLTIYDGNGRYVVALLRKAAVFPGVHKVLWDGTDSRGQAVPSGIYLCRLTTSSQTATSKMILLR